MENGRIARINRGNVAKFRGGGKGKGQTTTPIVDGIDFMKQTAGTYVIPDFHHFDVDFRL